MKKPILLIFLSFCVLILNAQDYLINFSGTGSSTTVETVTVENLTQGKSITFSGSKTLHLMSTVTGNSPLLEYLDYPMIVYPNPTSGDFTVQFDAQKSGMVTVAIYDMLGREIDKLQQRIQDGFQSFKVAGLGNGVYTIQVLMEDQKFAQKVVCNGNSTSTTSISYSGFGEAKQKDATLKSATSEQAWQYNTGDRLKFQGTFGKYSTIVMDVPTQSKTLSFDFVECTDADGNNYPVVKIGNQLWMAENLKTTKYNDGTAIPNETDNTNWMNLSSGAYCWYNNDIGNKTPYGALYNWLTVETNRLAPKGWHIPTKVDWSDLFSYLGGETVSGGKLKEINTKHWASPNSNATDEVGFGGLPGGIRLVDKQNSFFGSFSIVGTFGYLWSSDIDNSNTWAGSKELGFYFSNINNVTRTKQTGCSVRCIKDVPEKPASKFVSKSPKYSYPNNTVGQLKNGYFFPGYYNAYKQMVQFNILGPTLDGTGSMTQFAFDASGCYFDYNNDGFLDYFSFLQNFLYNPPGSKGGKYMIVSDILNSSQKQTKYYDCTTRWTIRPEVNDVNNDGLNEIIQASSDGHNLADGTNGSESPLKIIYFQADGSYIIKEIGEPMGIHDFSTGDIDGDGDIDILVWRYNTSVADSMPLIYLNDGKGNFELKDSYSIFYGLSDIIKENGQYVTTTVELFDLNNDGFLDIITGQNIGQTKTNSWEDYRIPNCRIYWGNSKGTFDLKNNFSDLPNISIKDFSVANSVLGFSFYDYDGDGDNDVFVVSTPNYGGFYVQLYENLGNKTFIDVSESKVGGYSHVHPRNNMQSGDFPNFYNIRLYDIDDDGDFDLIPDNLAIPPFEIVTNLYWENIGGSFVRRNY